MKSFYFTKKDIEKLEAPKKGLDYYHDDKERGLSLYITSNSVVTFFIRKVVDRKNVRIKIGRFPQIHIQQAREKAALIKVQIANGQNPINKVSDKDIKFKEIFIEYMTKYSKISKKTWKDDEREIKYYLGHWLDKSASSIKKQDVEDLHRKLGIKNGTYQANRVLARISSIYNKAIDWGHKLENPAVGVKRFKETARDRFLHKDEIIALLKELKNEKNTIIKDYILISLLTGARKSNVFSMKWKQIDFYIKIWRIPESKNGQIVNIPLTEKVIGILNFRKKENEELGFKSSEYVFPSNGVKGHLVDPNMVWKNILKRAGIKDLRLHDLRRTFGSLQAIHGSPMHVIGKSLGHKSTTATEIYARLSMDPVRKSVEKVTETIIDCEE